MSTIILQGPELGESSATEIANHSNTEIARHCKYFKLQGKDRIDPGLIARLRSQYPFDINSWPDYFTPDDIRLVIFDMDSTFINIECIDEIADLAGIKPQVAAITTAAMRGELDFAASLTQRVKLLAGLDAAVLDQVYENRLALNPGAQTMLDGLKSQHIKTALVSGGFTFFTERLRDRCGLDFTLANEIEISNGKLTGQVTGDIVGAEAKAGFLLSCCKQLDIAPKQAVAIGDGANDLLMLEQAGLGIAYHAKPLVQQQSQACINHCGLEAVLGLLDMDY